MTRSVLIALLFALATTSATVDVSGLPEKLQKLTELKSSAFHQLSELKTSALHSAATKLQDLKENAAYNLQHIADDIDLNNLYKLDILQIGPTLQKKYKLLKDFYNKPATKVNVVHLYGDELSSHFGPGDRLIPHHGHHHAKLIHHDHHAKLVHYDHGHHDHHSKLVHHDHGFHHAKLIHHDHGHHHHGHHHEHYHDLPPWVLVGAHI